jgi:hypothetical protein
MIVPDIFAKRAGRVPFGPSDDAPFLGIVVACVERRAASVS